MSDREKPLPKPPGTVFGRKRHSEHEKEQDTLLADQMAAAAAQGRLEEFLEKELPDSEHAKNLARMMMGMTGMMTAEERTDPGSRGKTEAPPSEGTEEAQTPRREELPREILKAAQGADVKGLMELLRREHQKRTSGPAADSEKEAAAAPRADQPMIDKDIIDELMRIAIDSGVSMDWVVLRAIKLYVEEYRKTGRL